MPNTDIDGMPVVILNKIEARMVYNLLYEAYEAFAVRLRPNSTVCSIIKKICDAYDLKDWTNELV